MRNVIPFEDFEALNEAVQHAVATVQARHHAEQPDPPPPATNDAAQTNAAPHQ